MQFVLFAAARGDQRVEGQIHRVGSDSRFADGRRTDRDRATYGLAVDFEQRTFDRFAQPFGEHVAAGLAADCSNGEPMIRDARQACATQFCRQ